MRLLFSYTLQGQKRVDTCLKLINESHIPLLNCRFSYCDEETHQYLLTKITNEQLLIQSCGLGYEVDKPLNVMRLSKNKPDYIIIGLNYNSRVTRFKKFIKTLSNFSKDIDNKLCIFTTKFLYPCGLYENNYIDSRLIICKGIHKEMMTNYIDTCEYLDTIDNDLSRYSKRQISVLGESKYTDEIVLENMNMSDNININLKNINNRDLFQQFLLIHFSDYI